MAATDVDIYARAFASEVYGYEPHANVLVQARGTTPAGDLPYRLAFVEDGLSVPGDASGVHGETNKSATRAFFLHLEQGLLAGEWPGGEVNETAKACLEWGYVRVHVVAVKSEAGFEAEAVPGHEPARLDTRFPEPVPERNGSVGCDNDLYSVLAGVPGTGDEGVGSRDGDGEER